MKRKWRPNIGEYIVFILILWFVFVAVIEPRLSGSGIAPAAINQLQNAGIALPFEHAINFVNSGCVDNAGATRSDCTFLTTAPANYSQTFVTQTTVVLAHNLNTTAVVVNCYDNGSPAQAIEWNTLQLTDANNVTVTFTVAQSGKCIVAGSSGSGVSASSYCADSTGSTTTYTCPLGIGAYNTGLTVTFVPMASNTAASTLNINSLGAKAIDWTDGTTALVADDLLAAGVYTLEYDGTVFRKMNGPDGPWIALPYANGWSDLAGGNQAGQYRKDRTGKVWIRGIPKGGTETAGTNIAVLPVGYRVITITNYMVDAQDTQLFRLDALTTGGLNLGQNITTGAGSYVVGLSAITYDSH